MCMLGDHSSMKLASLPLPHHNVHMLWKLLITCTILKIRSWAWSIFEGNCKCFSLILNLRLKVACCVGNHRKTIDTKWRTMDLQMLVVHKSFRIKRWTKAFWNFLKIYYKIESSFVSFGEEMYKRLQIETSSFSCLNVQVSEWVAIGYGSVAPYIIEYWL
jgi:hypothetical protein